VSDANHIHLRNRFGKINAVPLKTPATARAVNQRGFLQLEDRARN